MDKIFKRGRRGRRRRRSPFIDEKPQRYSKQGEFSILDSNSEFFVLLGPSCEWYKLQEFQDYFNNYSEAAGHGEDISGLLQQIRLFLIRINSRLSLSIRSNDKTQFQGNLWTILVSSPIFGVDRAAPTGEVPPVIVSCNSAPSQSTDNGNHGF